MNDIRDDIERYCRGELSPAEMHQLEKRALDDPFLADALEGATGVSPAEFSEDLKTLKQRIHKKDTPAVPLWIWSARIAAGIALLAVVGIFLFGPTRQDDRLAVNTPTENEKEITESQTPTDEMQESAPAVEDNQAATRRANRKVPRESVEEEEDIEEEILIPEIIDEAPPYAVPPARPKRPARVIQGYVVDSEDGRGLPGVNVTIRGTGTGTITDEEGNYQIAMDSLNSGLVFSYIGFESREIVPGSTNEVNVALDPDVSELSEVVVVGYGVSREPGMSELPVIEMAAPAGGKKAFKQYLEQNLRYPEQALNQKIEGKVTVQFTIETNGRISDFQVLKSIGYGCDEEVIRLIKEGPRWYPTKRNHEAVRDKVKVRMRFSLPKK